MVRKLGAKPLDRPTEMCDTTTAEGTERNEMDYLICSFRWYTDHSGDPGTCTLTIEMWKAELELVRIVLLGDVQTSPWSAVQV
jgi:hypothetical protein